MHRPFSHLTRSRRLFAAAAVAMLGITAVTAPAFAEAFADKTRHFSVDMIPGFKRVEQRAMDDVNKLAAKMRTPGVRVHYVMGFCAKSQRQLVYPYILVQHLRAPLNTMTATTLERAFRTTPLKEVTDSVENATRGIANNLQMNKPVFDRPNRRILVRLSMNVGGVGKVQGMTVGFPGKDGIVQFNYYDRDADFAKSSQAFLKMASTFQFEKGHEWQPRGGFPAAWGKPAPKALAKPDNTKPGGAEGGAQELHPEAAGGNPPAARQPTIPFTRASVRLSTAGRLALDRIARDLARGKGTVRIVGHAAKDETKGTIYGDDLELSLSRAAVVYRYLRGKGVSESRLIASARGSAKPAATAAGSSRVEIVAE